MNYAEGSARRNAIRQQIDELHVELRTLAPEIAPQEVPDYVFASSNGERTLSSLFGDKADLIVIHNMGKSCAYCTLWADGYNGVYDHLANRAAFVVTSPDAPDVQSTFAAARGWRFPMVSHRGSSFAADMGYRSESGGWQPGVSAFRRDGNHIVRVSDTGLKPHDDFCAVWHLFDLLPAGAQAWAPKFTYS